MKNDYFNEECIKSSYKFGETIVQNVCTYEEVRVPWDVIDWFGFVAILIAIMMLYIELLNTIKELKEGK
jgi:hypothetical protein